MQLMYPKSKGYTDTELFPTIGNAVNALSPDMGKPDICLPQKSLGSQRPSSFEYSDKNLLSSYQNFSADIYPAY